MNNAKIFRLIKFFSLVLCLFALTNCTYLSHPLGDLILDDNEVVGWSKVTIGSEKERAYLIVDKTKTAGVYEGRVLLIQGETYMQKVLFSLSKIGDDTFINFFTDSIQTCSFEKNCEKTKDSSNKKFYFTGHMKKTPKGFDIFLLDINRMKDNLNKKGFDISDECIQPEGTLCVKSLLDISKVKEADILDSLEDTSDKLFSIEKLTIIFN